MSREIPPQLPSPLRAVLDSEDLAAHDGFTLLLLTVRTDGWPHLAMLSVGEVVALDDHHLRLALWQSSTSTRNLTPEGPATLAAVVEDSSYSLRLSTRRTGMAIVPGDEPLARLEASIRAVAVDQAPYADLESGVRFRLKDPQGTIARWTHLRSTLRAGEETDA